MVESGNHIASGAAFVLRRPPLSVCSTHFIGGSLEFIIWFAGGKKNPPRVIKTLVWTAIILKFSPFRCRQLLNVHEILLKQDFLIYPGRPLPSLSPRGTLSSATKKKWKKFHASYTLQNKPPGAGISRL